MKHVSALLGLLLAASIVTPARGDSTIHNLTSGSAVQTQDEIPIYRPSSPGTDYKVNVGALAPLGFGVDFTSSGGNLALNLGADSGALQLPIGTTGQRPTGSAGMIRYNSSVQQVEAFVNGAWGQVGGSSFSLTQGNGIVLGTSPWTTGSTTISLAAPTTSTLGGLLSQASATSHQFVTYVDSAGSQHTAQPAASDVSGLAPSSTTDTTNAANISSGVLPAGRMPSPTTSTLGGILSIASATAHQVVQYLDSSGVQHLAQLAFSDISGTLNLATQVTNVLPPASGGSGFTSGPVVLTAFGDSTTAPSTFFTQQPNTYVDYLKTSLNTLPNNLGYGGTQACDATVSAFSLALPVSGTFPVYTFGQGVNDSANKGAGAYETAVYIPCVEAAASWLSIPASYKVMTSATTLTGTWEASSSGFVGTPTKSHTNGSTASFTFTTSGGPAICWFRNSDGDGGTFSAALVGGSTVNGTTATTTAIATGNGGTTGASPVIFTGLSAGSHTVNVTVTSATSTSNNVEPVGCGTPAPTVAGNYPVVVTGVLKQQNDTGSASTAAYNTDANTVSTTLSGYGLQVGFANLRAYVNSSSDMINTLHPNFSGVYHQYQAIAAAITALGTVPATLIPPSMVYMPTSDTTVGGSIGIGQDSLNGESPSAAYGNTAVGYQSMVLAKNATAIQNAAYGFQSLFSDISGAENAAFGYEALTGLKYGSNNTAFGALAMGGSINVGDANNTAVGYQALYTSQSGSNTGLGYNAGSSTTSGGSNTFVGANTGQGNTGGSNNTMLGFQVGNVNPQTGSGNILIGTSGAVTTPSSSTSSFLNLGNLLDGDMTYSTAVGKEALYLQSVSSSVDYVQVAGGVAGSPGTVVISGQGTDANVNIELLPKGTGAIGIGSAAPVASLDLSQRTDALSLPVGTTGQRPSGSVGMIRYNSTLSQVEGYIGSTWSSISSDAVRIVSSGTSDTATTADSSVLWNSTTVGTKTETLPACSTRPWKMTVVDELGTAGQYNINLVPASGTIQNAANFYLKVPFGWAQLKCDGVSNIVVNSNGL